MELRRKRRILAFGLAIVMFYVGAYSYLRISGYLIRIENRSSGGEYEVVARSEEWIDILMGMSDQKPVMRLYATVHQWTPAALNLTFAPLRIVEGKCWSIVHAGRQTHEVDAVQPFNPAAEPTALRSIGKVPEIRAGQPVSEEQLDQVEQIIKRPIPGELRTYFRELGDGYSFSPGKEQKGFMIGWLGDYRYTVAGFVDALREEAAPKCCRRNPPSVVEHELARRERWFPFYNFGGGGYMFCLDLNESPHPIRYYECVYWPNDSPDEWHFQLADSFLDFVQRWSRFCFSQASGTTLINLAMNAKGRFDWDASRFDPIYDRGSTEA